MSAIYKEGHWYPADSLNTLKAVTMSNADYEALTPQEKEELSGIEIFIPDRPLTGGGTGAVIIYNDVEYAGTPTSRLETLEEIVGDGQQSVGSDLTDAVTQLNSSIINLNNNKQDKNIWIKGNGTIYQSRLVSGASLAYWTYTFPNSNMRIVIVYCVFKAAIALSAGTAIATGFPGGSAGSPVALTGLKTVDNTDVPFYINTSGSLICMGSIAANGWAQCGGIYVSGGAL